MKHLLVGMMLLVAGATPAAAQTLTFDNAAASLPSNVYREAGYIFQAAPGATFKALTDSGSPALEGPNPFAPPFQANFTLSREDGALFDFVSLDVFQADGNGLGVPIGFTALLGTGQTILFIANTPEYGHTNTPATRTAIILPTTFRGLKSVTWANGAEWHQFDNVVVSGATGAVPEPASWGLLLAGFGGIGFAMRRRDRRAGQERAALG
jgi:hypothetical protein